MNQINDELANNQDSAVADEVALGESSKSKEVLENQTSENSATTLDVPDFGWSSYAERVNGRFAMIGFIAVLLIEVISRDSFLHWIGMLP